MKTFVRGLIGKEDCNIGSGTFSRTTSSGGLQTMTSLNLNPACIVFADQMSGSDATAKIQAAINFLAALPVPGGVVDARNLTDSGGTGSTNIDPGTVPITLLLGPTTYHVKKITIRNNFRIIGAGSSAQTILLAVDTTTAMFQLDQTAGAVAAGFSIQGLRCYAKAGNTAQVCFNMIAPASGGGLWYSFFKDIFCGGSGTNEFGGGSFIFDGNATPTGINQFLTFEDVRAYRQAGSVNPALKITSYNGQFSFFTCEFDGATGDTTASACNVQLDDGLGVNLAPYNICFINTTIQQASGTGAVGVKLRGCTNVSFLNCHAEALTGFMDQAIGAVHGNFGNSVSDSFFLNNVGQGVSGFLVKSDANSALRWSNNSVFGTPTSYFTGTTTLIIADQSYNASSGTVGLRSILSSPTINGTPTGTGIPTATLKSGDASTSYNSGSTSFAAVDSTRLKYTVTIPLGWTLLIHAIAAIGTNTAAATWTFGIADNGTVLTSVAGQNASAGFTTAAAVCWAITGDGNSHAVDMRYKTGNASDAVFVSNASGNVPAMTFLLTPSN